MLDRSIADDLLVLGAASGSKQENPKKYYETGNKTPEAVRPQLRSKLEGESIQSPPLACLFLSLLHSPNHPFLSVERRGARNSATKSCCQPCTAWALIVSLICPKNYLPLLWFRITSIPYISLLLVICKLSLLSPISSQASKLGLCTKA
jgi:hypothetical protein